MLRVPIFCNVAAAAGSLVSLHWRLAEDMSSRSASMVAEALANARLVQMHAAEGLETAAYGDLLMEGYTSTSTLAAWPGTRLSARS